jgi:hypothetical protein
MLTRKQVRSFYNRFGKKQDWQRFYEGPAVQDLLAHGAFEKAHAVFELGSGTGWFAEHLLERYLPESATYLCLISLTPGFTFLSRITTWLWKEVFRFRPGLLGGCRPVRLLDCVSKNVWQVVHHNSVVTFGIPSQVVVARKLPS